MKFEDLKKKGWYRGLKILWGICGIIVALIVIFVVWEETATKYSTINVLDKYSYSSPEELGAQLRASLNSKNLLPVYEDYSDLEIGERFIERNKDKKETIYTDNDLETRVFWVIISFMIVCLVGEIIRRIFYYITTGRVFPETYEK